MAISLKRIKQECNEMSAGWEQAAGVEFNGIKKADFDADRAAALAVEDEIEDDEAALKAKKDRRDDMYKNLDSKRTKVGQGVAGNPDYGDDSPIYGAMGFVRKSERKSGLTRKKKEPNG